MCVRVRVCVCELRQKILEYRVWIYKSIVEWTGRCMSLHVQCTGFAHLKSKIKVL